MGIAVGFSIDDFLLERLVIRNGVLYLGFMLPAADLERPLPSFDNLKFVPFCLPSLAKRFAHNDSGRTG